MLFLIGIIIITTICLLLILFILSSGKPKPFLDKDDKIIKNSISEKVFIDINGTKQGMFIKGVNKDNPIVLYLQGGMPDYFLTEKYPTMLEKNFTMVWWEQRGCGISNTSNSLSYTSIEQLVDDTKSLTEYLLKRFNKQKIYLMGHSGGTFIGIYVIDKNPELYNAYIGIAQMSNQYKSEMLAFEFMLKRYKELGNDKMVSVFKSMHFEENGEIPSEYIKTRDFAMHELGIGTMKEMNNLITGIFFQSLLFSEYTMTEKYHLWSGKSRSGISQNWNRMINTNLIESKNSFRIPVYFFHGSYDYTCSYELAKEYFEKIEAPVKGFYTFGNSAHSPLFEEPIKMNKIMIDDVMNLKTDLADKL